MDINQAKPPVIRKNISKMDMAGNCIDFYGRINRAKNAPVVEKQGGSGPKPSMVVNPSGSETDSGGSGSYSPPEEDQNQTLHSEDLSVEDQAFFSGSRSEVFFWDGKSFPSPKVMEELGEISRSLAVAFLPFGIPLVYN